MASVSTSRSPITKAGSTALTIAGSAAATPRPAGGRGAFLHFALYQSKGERTTGAQISFEVEDLAAAHDAAIAAGATPLHESRVEPWGKSTRYADFDGNVVELTERP